MGSPTARISLTEERTKEVVNHQVQDHVHVQSPRREHAQAVGFEKHGLGDEGKRGPYRRIEAFQMTGLGNPPETFGQLH
jgi:hypothetical protein